MLWNYANSLIFIGGDFNCPLSKEDKNGGQDLSSKKNVITGIKQLMGSFDPDDIWRYSNPTENQFTWWSSDLKVKCRLDHWLISRDSLRIVDSGDRSVPILQSLTGYIAN